MTLSSKTIQYQNGDQIHHGYFVRDQNASLYGIPIGYDADADAQSWAAMLSLFEKTLIE